MAPRGGGGGRHHGARMYRCTTHYAGYAAHRAAWPARSGEAQRGIPPLLVARAGAGKDGAFLLELDAKGVEAALQLLDR